MAEIRWFGLLVSRFFNSWMTRYSGLLCGGFSLRTLLLYSTLHSTVLMSVCLTSSTLNGVAPADVTLGY